MLSNSETSLASLAAEVNALEADRVVGNRNTMEAMGHKLIAIRAILREQNGFCVGGRESLDGPGPKGWSTWARTNLSITFSHAQVCIREAFHPGESAKHKAAHRSKNGGQATSAEATGRQIQLRWKRFTLEERDMLGAIFVKLALEQRQLRARQ